MLVKYSFFDNYFIKKNSKKLIFKKIHKLTLNGFLKNK